MPLTWWIAGVREALFPGGPSSIGGAGSSVDGRHRDRTRRSSPVLLGALLVTGAVWYTRRDRAASGSSERRAKERGLLDQTTGS